MSIKIRSVLSTQNTALDTSKDIAFPDNNNKEITAAILRTWLDELIAQVQDIIDSYFNKLDELRITSTLAFDDGSTNTDWDGNVFPAFQGDVNNQLAQRLTIFESTTYSNDVAFVSDNGNDGNGELGNLSKTFLTINAAIAAVPINGIVKVLGGNYTESIVINKEGITLDISGCQIVGRVILGARNITINAYGARITGNGIQSLFANNSSPSNQSGLQVKGGVWDAVNQQVISLGTQLSSSFFRDCIFTSTYLGNVIFSTANESNFQNCIINATNAGNAYALRVEGANTITRVLDCIITANGGNAIGLAVNSTLRINRGTYRGGNYGLFATVTTGNEVDLIVENATIIGENNNGVSLNQKCDNVRFTRTTIVTENIDKESVNLGTARTTAKDTLFEYCTFFAGANKEVFLQNETDTSITYVNKCSFNKVAFVYTAQIVETDTCYQPNTPLIL